MSRDRSRSPRSSDRDRDRDRSSRRSHSSPADREVLEGFWKPVREEPQNFDAWTQLLHTIENVDDTKSAREAFDSFLEKFPYCFGYWRKYAEFERRHKHHDRAIEVYERGVAAIPLSIDLWVSYLAYYKDYVKDSDVKEKRIRYVYERALTAAGLEFHSDKLWEDYVTWEINNENFVAAMGIYDRLLKVPTMLYSSHFERCQEFVNTHDPHEIISRSEYDRAFADVEEHVKEKGQEIFNVEEIHDGKSDAEESDADEREEQNDDGSDNEVEKSENKEFDNGNAVDGSDHEEENGSREKRNRKKEKSRKRRSKHRSSGAEYRKKYTQEALALFRVKILDKRRKMHLKTEQEVSKRWAFEDQIKRPYFHVKPLERSQLKNWRQYLEFEIKEGSHDRVKVLFERCLIACALYEDMWIRYARYMEKVDPTEARSVYDRACRVHLARKPNPHIAWAMFEEKQGNCDEAKAILAKYDKSNPGLAVIQMRRLGIERRYAVSISQKREDSIADYSDLCRRYELLIHDDQFAPRVSSHFAMKFARFQSKIRRDNRLAEKIILDALERDKGNEGLYLQMVDIAFNADPFNLEQVVKSLDYALDSKHLTDTQKLEFSRRKYELLEEFSDDINEIQDQYEFHMKLSKSLGLSGSNSRKRAADAPEGAAGKKSRPEGPPAVAGAGSAAAVTGPPLAMMGVGPPPCGPGHPSQGAPNMPTNTPGYYYYGAPSGPGPIPPPFSLPPAYYPAPSAAQPGYYYPPNTY